MGTIAVATTITALQKQIKIVHAALQVYIGPEALITQFLQEWKAFLEESDNRLADLQRQMDPDLPGKMQFFIAQVCNDWFDSAHFELPDEGSLGWTQVKWGILQNNQHSQPLYVLSQHEHPSPHHPIQQQRSEPRRGRSEGRRPKLQGEMRNDPA